MSEIITVPADRTPELMQAIMEARQQIEIISMTQMIGVMDILFKGGDYENNNYTGQ